MVDWDRVAELRAEGMDWGDIAADPKVGFHPDTSVGDPGRALRALYHRERARSARQGPAPAPKKRPSRDHESRWTLVRAAYLLVPVVGIWFALAFVAPSPVGLLVPAIPYLGLVLAGAAFFLIYALWRTREPRWSSAFRGTVIGGVVLGLIFAGMVGLVGSLVFGCPYLPPASAVPSVANASNWHGGSGLPAWDSGGKPVVFFYGATWCPYCSASSWAIWKALSEYGSVSGVHTGYSSSSDVYANTPEMVLANLQLSSGAPVVFQASEYTGGVDGVAPGTSNCYQLAYVSAYSGGSIPFLEVGGKYVHGGTTIINPTVFTSYDGTGAGTVRGDIQNQTGQPWHAVANETFWIMALIAKTANLGPSNINGMSWKAGMKTAVEADLAQL